MDSKAKPYESPQATDRPEAGHNREAGDGQVRLLAEFQAGTFWAQRAVVQEGGTTGSLRN
jgi:hypothetical protein